MSARGSKSAVFINTSRDPRFKKGFSTASPTEVMQMEALFKRWKSKPWSEQREKVLGKLSTQIYRAKNHLNGISKFSSLPRLG